MQHNADEAIRFLQWLRPTGWALVAISTDRKNVDGEIFTSEQINQIGSWLAKHKDRNIYYQVNTVGSMAKKAVRSQVRSLDFLHVDIDPRAGEDMAEESVRIQRVLQNPPPGYPSPSAIVFSGGGYNALWRLQEPVLCGSEEVAEDLKLYNLNLEVQFGGDNCHNVDRILRLPGSVNWPDERKKKKGRVPAQSSIIYLGDEVFPISQFPKAEAPRSGSAVSVDGKTKVARKRPSTLAAEAGVKRLNNVDDLGDAVSPRIKMIIVQGTDPDDANRFGTSRSEWLFMVVCELIRAKISDEVIYSVITDPGFAIASSVVEKGSTMERYANRQIERARESVIDPQLCELNEKHAVIGNYGGKCRIVEELVDHSLGRSQLTTQSFEDFRNRYMAQKVAVGTNAKTGESVFMPLGQWWLQHPSRRQYETIVFAPGKELSESYNLWKGFACEAKPGDLHQVLLTHILENVCGGNQAHYHYLVRWMARAVQHPDTQGEVAVVFRGDQGTGKGTVAREFGRLWGRHYMQISDPKHLVGSFNAHLRDAVVVFADEAFYAGDKKHESILKTLITEELLVLEGKGKDAVTGRNYVHLMMASNGNWVIPAGVNERRYFVLDVLDRKMQNSAYFEKIRTTMDQGGRENFLFFLQTLDLSGWDVRKVPQTTALQDQKLLSLSPEQEWWYQKLQNGKVIPNHVSWNAPVFKEDLRLDYVNYSKDLGIPRRLSSTVLGKFLYSTLPEGWPRVRQLVRTYISPGGERHSERSYAYIFPDIQECRKWWDEKFGGPYEWQTIEEEGPVESIF